MPVGKYTSQVVAKVIERTPPTEIWLGGNATLAWAIEILGIQWMYRLMFRREYGLDRSLLSSMKQD